MAQVLSIHWSFFTKTMHVLSMQLFPYSTVNRTTRNTTFDKKENYLFFKICCVLRQGVMQFGKHVPEFCIHLFT